MVFNATFNNMSVHGGGHGVLSICVINSIFIDKRGQGDDIQKVGNLNIK
jgi:hypothetical protein